MEQLGSRVVGVSRVIGVRIVVAPSRVLDYWCYRSIYKRKNKVSWKILEVLCRVIGVTSEFGVTSVFGVTRNAVRLMEQLE